jgi:hypothetical protein
MRTLENFILATVAVAVTACAGTHAPRSGNATIYTASAFGYHVYVSERTPSSGEHKVNVALDRDVWAPATMGPRIVVGESSRPVTQAAGFTRGFIDLGTDPRGRDLGGCYWGPAPPIPEARQGVFAPCTNTDRTDAMWRLTTYGSYAVANGQRNALRGR